MNPKLGVIVPYRDREKHLKKFIPHITDFLNEHTIPFEILVVEQADDLPFNRGRLLNVGFDILEETCDYFCFHDIDMLPMEADYSYAKTPLHLATKLSSNDYELTFPSYFGGVTLFNKDDFKSINGFSNEYWGWGFEDDDLLYRCSKNGLPVDKKVYGNDSKINYVLQISNETEGIEIISNNKVLKKLFDSDFTISVNSKPDKITKDNSSDADEYFIIKKPGYDSGLSFTSFNRFKAELFEESGKSVSINSELLGEIWTNLILTKNGNELYFYLNGELVGKEFIDDVRDYNDESLYIGHSKFRGVVSSVSIWNKNITLEEVNTIYNSSQPMTNVLPTGLQVHYDFKNIINNKVIDLSGNNNNGVLTGGKQIEMDSKLKSSLTIPLRRDGKFLTLSHRNNSWNDLSWVHKETRLNQIKYLNEVRQDMFDTNIDGLNTLRYNLEDKEVIDDYTKVKVS